MNPSRAQDSLYSSTKKMLPITAFTDIGWPTIMAFSDENVPVQSNRDRGELTNVRPNMTLPFLKIVYKLFTVLGCFSYGQTITFQSAQTKNDR